MSWYRWDGPDLVLMLRVQPRARDEAFAEIQGDRRRLRLSTPPVDGRANQRLLAWLAEVCDVPRARVQLLSGDGSRDKRVRIERPGRLPPDVVPAPQGC